MRDGLTRCVFLTGLARATIASQLTPRGGRAETPEDGRIVYPQPLRPGDTVASPSAGMDVALRPRLEFSIEALRRLGYRVREGRCPPSDEMVSASELVTCHRR